MSFKNTSVTDAEIVQTLRDYFNTEIEELFSCNFSRIRSITAQMLADRILENNLNISCRKNKR